MTNKTNSKKSYPDDSDFAASAAYWTKRARKAEKELETIKAFASFWQPQSVGQRLDVIASRLKIEEWYVPRWAAQPLKEAHDKIIEVTMDMREGRSE